MVIGYEPERTQLLKTQKLVITLCLLWAAGTLAYASLGHSQTRNELLYSTHCVTCHTSIIHWRKKTLAKDWHSLKFQVHRWQSILELGWSEEEIIDVTHYLNGVHYHFSVTDKQTLTERNNPYPDSLP